MKRHFFFLPIIYVFEKFSLASSDITSHGVIFLNWKDDERTNAWKYTVKKKKKKVKNPVVIYYLLCIRLCICNRTRWREEEYIYIYMCRLTLQTLRNEKLVSSKGNKDILEASWCISRSQRDDGIMLEGKSKERKEEIVCLNDVEEWVSE